MPPYRIEKLLAAENDAGPGHQELEQAEFGGGQLQFLALQPNPATAAVELEASRFEAFRRRGLRAELDLDPGNQLADEERLHHVVVGAQLEPDDAVRLRGAGGEKDHGDRSEFGVRADALADIQAIGIGQHDIEQDQVRPFAAAQLDRAFAGLRAHEGEAFLFEVVLEESKEVRVVFNQHDFFHVSNPFPG